MSDKNTIEKLLQGMLVDINKITGKQDGDLTECINTLLNGSGQGGGSSSGANAPCLTATSPIIPGATRIDAHTDTQLNTEITLDDFVVTDTTSRLQDVVKVGDLDLYFTCQALQTGDSLSIQGKPQVYLNKNGNSTIIRKNIGLVDIEELLGYEGAMTYVLNQNSYVDSGAYNVPILIDIWNNVSNTAVIYADSYISIGGRIINLNQRDTSVLRIGYGVWDLTSGIKVQKIHWYGYAAYSTSSTYYTWELYLFSTGDAMLFLKNQPISSYDGKFSFFGNTYSINAEIPYVTFYLSTLDFYTFQQSPVIFDISNSKRMDQPPTHTLENLLMDRTWMLCQFYNTRKDDDTVAMSLTSTWNYNGVDINTLYVSGNSWIGLGNAYEHIRLNRRDCAIWSLFKQEGEVLIEGTPMRFIKVRWEGHAAHSSAATATDVQIWDLYLFGNGDAMIQLVNKPDSNWNGTFYFFNEPYKLSAAGDCVSFYRMNELGTLWSTVPSIYSLNSTYKLKELLGTTYMMIQVHSGQSDGLQLSVGCLPWSYNGTSYSSLIVSGDSWIGLGGATEHIKLNRRDAAVWYIYKQLGKVLINGNEVRFTKIRWEGHAYYSSPATANDLLIWDLYLFSTGDAMIHLVNKPTSYWDGSFSFFGQAFTFNETGDLRSFYRQNAEGTSWTVSDSLYDASLSLKIMA